MKQYQFTPQLGKVKTINNLKIRKGDPSTMAEIVCTIPKDTEIKFLGWISNGEIVEGNGKWFLDNEGNFFWSGVVVEIIENIIPPIVSSEKNDFVTLDQLTTILISLPSKNSEILDSLNKAMREFSINTPLRRAAFIAQTAHESLGYTKFIEGFYYSSIERIKTIFGAKFKNIDPSPYMGQPEKLANYVYANRYGNGDEASGDGWRYRGRGVMQITFKENYKACGIALGLDLVKSPELLEQPLNIFRSAGWYWNNRKLNDLADKGDFLAITRVINGGTIGIESRINYYNRAKSIFGI